VGVIGGEIKCWNIVRIQHIKELETRHPRQTSRVTQGKPPRLEIVNGANDSHLMDHFLRVFTRREKKGIGDLDRKSVIWLCLS
jgi:hypothetical protein